MNGSVMLFVVVKTLFGLMSRLASLKAIATMDKAIMGLRFKDRKQTRGEER